MPVAQASRDRGVGDHQGGREIEDARQPAAGKGGETMSITGWQGLIALDAGQQVVQDVIDACELPLPHELYFAGLRIAYEYGRIAADEKMGTDLADGTRSTRPGTSRDKVVESPAEIKIDTWICGPDAPVESEMTQGHMRQRRKIH